MGPAVITGGCGFTVSLLAKLLTEEGYEAKFFNLNTDITYPRVAELYAKRVHEVNVRATSHVVKYSVQNRAEDVGISDSWSGDVNTSSIMNLRWMFRYDNLNQLVKGLINEVRRCISGV